MKPLTLVAKQSRTPLRTFSEMADEFGVSVAVLRGAMRDLDAPKAEMILTCRSTKMNYWYKPNEMRQWWKNRKTA